LRKDYFDDWKFRTQGGAAEIQSGGMRNMWWDDDPSETPYRPRSAEQFAGEHEDTLPDLSQRRTPKGRRLGERKSTRGEMRDMWEGISAEAQEEINSLRECRMYEAEGEIISRVEVGVKNRVERLRAIGNGQVPAVARAAFMKLMERMDNE